MAEFILDGAELDNGCDPTAPRGAARFGLEDDENEDELDRPTESDLEAIDDSDRDDEEDEDNARQLDSELLAADADADMADARRMAEDIESRYAGVTYSSDDSSAGSQPRIMQFLGQGGKKKKKKRHELSDSDDDDDDDDDDNARAQSPAKRHRGADPPASSPVVAPVVAQAPSQPDEPPPVSSGQLPRIPCFEYAGGYAKKAVSIFNPEPVQDDGDDDDAPRVRILSFKVPFDVDKPILQGDMRSFLRFQTVYYVMSAATHLCAMGRDIKTYLWVLKKQAGGGGGCMLDRLDQIIFNKGKGHYLMEIHIESDEALFQLSQFLEKGDVFKTKWSGGGLSPHMDLVTRVEKVARTHPDAAAAGDTLMKSLPELASGLVDLARWMGTIGTPAWSESPKVPNIVKVADYELTDEQPPQLQSCTTNDRFWSMFSREAVIGALYRDDPSFVAEMNRELAEGNLFVEGFQAYPLHDFNIRHFIKFTDLPGTETFDLTKQLADIDKSAGWFQELNIGSDDSTKDFHDMLIAKGKELETFEERFELASSYIVGKHVLLQPFEYNMRDFMQHIAESDALDFQQFVGSLSGYEGFRVGTVYVDELWRVIHDAEKMSKLHTIRLCSQFIHNMVFLVKPPSSDVPGLMITGDAGGGKSQILNMIDSSSFHSMVETKAWSSEQASFQKAPQQINLYHEGLPGHTNVNMANNEQKRSNMKQNFGTNNTFTVERMSQDGEIIKQRFKNRSKNFMAMNFNLNLIDPALRDRNIAYSSNKTMAPGGDYRDVTTCALAMGSDTNKLQLERAHDEIGRLRFCLFNAYDVLFTLCSQEKDGRLAEWITGRIKSDLPKLFSQGLCNARQNNYTRLFSRVYTLHSLVTVLMHGIAVPGMGLIDEMRALVKNDSQRQVIDDLRALRDDAGNTKPFMKRLLTRGDWLCSEVVMFEGVDSILFGVGAQMDSTKEKAVDEVLRFVKIIAYKHASTKSFDDHNPDGEDAYQESSEYVELMYDKKTLVKQISVEMLCLNIKRSDEFINMALDELDTRIMMGGNNKKGSKGIKTSDRSGLSIHRGLLSTVLTPAEEAVINSLNRDERSSVFRNGQMSDVLRGTDERVHLATNIVFNSFKLDDTAPAPQGSGCHLLSDCFREFDDNAKIVNSSSTVAYTPVGGFWLSQRFVGLASQDNKRCPAHSDFAKIMKTIGVSPTRGKFKISEPNLENQLRPGVVQYTPSTHAYEPPSEIKIANINYKSTRDRKLLSRFQLQALDPDARNEYFLKGGNEDLEATANWKHFQRCEMYRRLAGENQNELRKMVFNRLLSLDAIQKTINTVARGEDEDDDDEW